LIDYFYERTGYVLLYYTYMTVKRHIAFYYIYMTVKGHVESYYAYMTVKRHVEYLILKFQY